MDSKKKMIIAISSFAMIILAAVVAIVAVLAAQNVTIKSSINVTYTSSEVAGTVTASYQVKGGSTQSIGSITYTGAEAGTPTNNLNAEEIKITSLTSTNNYVDFIFTFTNTGSSDYTATVTLPTTSSNFTVSYEAIPTGGSNTSFTIAANTTTAVTYKVRYTITNVAKDATLSGTFSWNLA